jgi:hypothetical protein
MHSIVRLLEYKFSHLKMEEEDLDLQDHRKRTIILRLEYESGNLASIQGYE